MLIRARFFIIAVLVVLAPIQFAVCQQAEDQAAAQIESLDRVLTSILQIRKARSEKIEEIKVQPSAARQERLSTQLDELNQKLTDLENNFLAISSSVETESFSGQEALKIEWGKELEDLLSPLFLEVRRLTSRPREFARLRNDVEHYQRQLELIDQAKKNIDQLTPQIGNPELQAELQNVQATWSERQGEIQTRLSIDQHRLDQLERAKKSFSESVGDIFEIFFRSRGRNLLVALLVAFLAGLLFRGFHRVLENRSRSPGRKGATPHRLLNVLSLIASTAGGFLAFLATLYFFGDWVLLILGILLLLGVIWTSKQALPMLINQAMLLLNIGPVREGERVVIEGVPWHVKRISLYSELENPLLSRKILRLPIRDLHSMRSQEADVGEPWFPTRNGEWVLLTDGTHGYVHDQSEEFVTLVLLGGASKFFTTRQFLDQNPQVLSHGFRVSTLFGLDYAVQRDITTIIPDAIDKFIRSGLVERGLDSSLRQLTVEFEDAGPSSLNLRVMADFSGEVGERYSRLHRLMNRLCVEACNAHGWTIPFQQLTVHMAAQGG